MTNQSELSQAIETMDNDVRFCSKCGNMMTSGYCIGDGDEYYCSAPCLHEVYTQEEYNSMYDDDCAYYTDWGEK